MNLLLKNIIIIDSNSSWANKGVDLHIKNGVIQRVGYSLEAQGADVIEEPGLHCSLGWFDMNAHIGEPGFEQRENFESFVTAASYGGFTEVAVLPNLNPITQSRSSVQALKSNNTVSQVTIHPIGAVTENCVGKDLAELLDLHQAGAVAFSDGDRSIQTADTLIKALNYLSLTGSLLINRSEDSKMALGGQMHEGLASTRLGLKGIPSLAEDSQVIRDLQILEYAPGRLHFSQISTASAVEAIRNGKKKGLAISCDVASYQCAFIDASIVPFDSNYKVSPPFRGEEDRLAILEGLADGTIDALVSAHTPLETEAKQLEFDDAHPGIINSQTSFSIANETLSGKLTIQQLIYKLTYGPRIILQLPVPSFEEGSIANLTLFHPDKEWEFNQSNNASLSNNSPFLGKKLKGLVYGTIHNNRFSKNPAYVVA
ncbi:amidohydrolase family protein [Nibribacter ruber]|uniref:Amidohydrolase family protein n=1 Tax=Nibribacter ruber TaxID=2698458 RepID=A0A6P1NZ38_9BACT|nr:dihydroorotase [Nibribacter ruber]QHL87714.1 amidohydrolase family protein [Nibribacter ruber]